MKFLALLVSACAVIARVSAISVADLSADEQMEYNNQVNAIDNLFDTASVQADSSDVASSAEYDTQGIGGGFGYGGFGGYGLGYGLGGYGGYGGFGGYGAKGGAVIEAVPIVAVARGGKKGGGFGGGFGGKGGFGGGFGGKGGFGGGFGGKKGGGGIAIAAIPVAVGGYGGKKGGGYGGFGGY